MDDDDFGPDPDLSDIISATETSKVPPTNIASSSSSNQQKAVQPKPQALPSRAGPSSILVSSRQKGNPVLSHIKGVPWEWADIPADYVLGNTTCALFLSLKYHRLHPEYVYSRIRLLAGKYNLRILLTLVDIDNHQEPLKELAKTSLINNLTLILAWSSQEAGRYLELYKSYENASASSIRARESNRYSDQMQDFITTPRTINKTDALSLVSNFGSIRGAVNARPEEIAMVQGWGEKKVQQWCRTVGEPFRVHKAARTTARRNLGNTLTRDTTAGEASKGTPAPQSATLPVPIGSLPSRGSNGTPEPDRIGQKRPASGLEPWDAGIDEDEDEAYLHAEMSVQNSARTKAGARGTANSSATRNDDELDSGVAAALKRLKEREG